MMYSANVGFSDPTVGLKKSARRGFRQRYLLPPKGSFMSIHKHLIDKSAFGPVAIEAMSKAFEEACIALQVYAGDEKGREIIATRIIDLARAGLIDPTALRDRVIAEARLSASEEG
jgi:hypothetical protein